MFRNMSALLAMLIESDALIISTLKMLVSCTLHQYVFYSRLVDSLLLTGSAKEITKQMTFYKKVCRNISDNHQLLHAERKFITKFIIYWATAVIFINDKRTRKCDDVC